MDSIVFARFAKKAEEMELQFPAGAPKIKRTP
jgi:hypothetical protein